MNSAAVIHRNEKGFTLLEIIVTLIVAAIMGAMLVQFMGTSMIRSAEPVVRVQQGFSLNEAMEKMTADFKKLLAQDTTPLATLKSYIENGNDPNSTPYYGSYTWQTKYVTFNSSNNENQSPCTSNCKVLKITITNADQTLTVLFSE